MTRGGLLLFATALAVSAQSGGVISGRVTSTAHGDPVAGATVTLRGLDDGPAQTYITETAADGRFSIANMVPGTYEPRPSKTGYEQRTPDHFATAKDFPPVTVEAGKATAPIELHLIPDGVVAGRVVDSDGDPVRHAQVEAQQYGYVSGKKQLRTLRGAQTDDRGEYRLFHLPPGKYWLHVQPSSRRNQPQFQPRLRQLAGSAQMQNVPPPTGLAAAYYPGSPDVTHATELQVAPGAELDGIDVRVTPERLYAIRGRVTGDGNKGNFSVFAQSLSPPEGRPNGFPMRIENDQYELSGIPPGKYAVIGQQFSNQQQPGPPVIDMPRQYARQMVEIVDRDVDNIDLTFEPGALIKGVIKGEGSASAKDAVNINLTPADSGLMTFGMMFGGGARVGTDGTFTLQTAPGVYNVRVNGRQVYLKTVLIGKQAAPDRKIDTARLSGDLTLVVSNDYGKVEGTVVDEAGKPVFNANVTLIPDQRQDDLQERFRSALTKADGKFSVAAVQPGEYRAYAWLGVEQGAPQDAEFRKPFEDRAVVVKVEPNGKQTVDLKVIQPAQ
jgi:5-hydroxyisourate hydrolase-like protein (transthyretin family)